MSHSRLAASASSRWIRCPGSVAYIEHLKNEGRIPEQGFTSDAARLGTAVHAVIEYCINENIHPEELSQKTIAKILKSDKETKVVKWDDRALRGATVCMDRVNLIKPEFDEVFAERRYDLSFRYGIDLGGTCDISAFSDKGLLGIEDYKNGKGLVEVEGNSQLRIYALGAYHNENEWYDFKKLRTTIIQPNARHPNGPIRSEEIKIKELLKWEEKTLAPAVDLIAKETATLTPGKIQCTWCEARPLCEANATQTLQIAQLEFKDLAEPKADLPTPNSLTREQLAFVIDNEHRIQQFLKSCREYAERVLEEGESLGDFHLVDKIGNRRFIGEKDLKKKLRKNKLTVKECTIHPDPKMMTVTELESYLKTQKKWDKDKITEFMSSVTERPKTGKTIAKDVNTAESDFSKVKTNRKSKKRK